MRRQRELLASLAALVMGLSTACNGEPAKPPPSAPTAHSGTTGGGSGGGGTGTGGGGTGTGGGSTGGGGSGWKSVVGQAGFFGQTFDDDTWTEKTVGSASLYSVTCVGNEVGWVAGASGLVAHTLDGGRSWTAQDAHLTANLYAVRFGTTSVGVVAGESGALAVTQDGGSNWAVPARMTSATLRGAAVAADLGVMFVAGDGGTVLRSADDGVTWTRSTVLGAADFHGIASDTAAHEIVAVDSAGTVWASSDVGQTFVREAVAQAPLDAVAMSDDGGVSVVVGAEGTTLVRVGASPWVSANVPGGVELRAALVTDGGSRLYVAGDAGSLYTSADLGKSWQLQPLGTQATLYGLEDL